MLKKVQAFLRKLSTREVTDVGAATSVKLSREQNPRNVQDWLRLVLSMPYVLYILVAGVLGSYCLGYFIAGYNLPPQTLVNVVENRQPAEDLEIPVDPGMPVETPVPLGERLVVRRDYAVKNSKELLDCIQAIGTKEYKLNFNNKYFVSGMAVPNALAFILSDRDVPKVYTQFLIPLNNPNPLTDFLNEPLEIVPEGEDVLHADTTSLTAEDHQRGVSMDSSTIIAQTLPEVIDEVNSLEIDSETISFKAGDIKLTGVWKEFSTPDGEEKFALLSLQEGVDVSDSYCADYADAMLSSLDLYYNQLYPRPTQIQGDIIDKTFFISDHNLLVATPRSGLASVTGTRDTSVLEFKNREIFGDLKLIVTTSQQSLFGFYEALEYIKYDIETAHNTEQGTPDSIFVIDMKYRATWSNQETYYLEGHIGTQRVISYVFYNPVRNNFSTITALLTADETSLAGEQLLNTMIERLEFVKERE